MKIIVCISNVPDTTTKIRLAADGQSVDLAGVQWIINPWDELALSRAVELKEKNPAVIEKVTVINVGNKETEPVVRKALAIGADDAIRINTVASDAWFVAGQLAAAIKEQACDIILCGIESSDNNGCSVGAMLSEMLSIPSVSSVSFLDVADGNICLNREIDGGYEKIKATVPFVAIVQKGIALEPKIATMRGIMSARTKPLQVVEPVNIDPLTEETAYTLPPAKAACKMIDAGNIARLVELLRDEAKVI